MFILANELGVQTTQFDACGIGGELPVDPGSTKVAIAFPCDNLVRQPLPVVDARARHCRPSTLNSHSAMFSQLPCFGV